MLDLRAGGEPVSLPAPEATETENMRALEEICLKCPRVGACAGPCENLFEYWDAISNAVFYAYKAVQP